MKKRKLILKIKQRRQGAIVKSLILLSQYWKSEQLVFFLLHFGCTNIIFANCGFNAYPEAPIL